MKLLLASSSGTPSVVLIVVFWLLLLLWAIGHFGWRDNPSWVSGSGIVIAILLAILGWAALGNPL